MWKALRDRRLSGLKFRRQFPIGPFIADLYCHEIKLLIELDGEVHTSEQGIARDLERNAYLEGLGFTILRFPNQRIFEDAEGVTAEILAFARRKIWI